MPPNNQASEAILKQTGDVVLSETDRKIRRNVQKLIEEIENKITQTGLRSATYDELGRLLDLLPNVELTNDENLICMAELAASILLSQLEGEHLAVKEGKARGAHSSSRSFFFSRLPLFARSSTSNIALAKRIRKKIAQEIRIHKNPLAAVLSAAGSPAAQLISGLTWFTILFLLFLGVGVGSFYLFKAKNQTTDDAYNLGFDQGYQLGSDPPPDKTGPPNTLESGEIEGSPSSRRPAESPTIPVDATNQPQAGIIQHLDTSALMVETMSGRREGRDDFLFSAREISGIYLVIFAGGLGSIVSIMIRLRALDSQSRSQSVIPFFVGFFKPVIGTAFSLFVIALLEAKVVVIPAFEIDSDLKKYLYFVVAFTAGFSEVLVPDLLNKTEKSISNDNT